MKNERNKKKQLSHLLGALPLIILSPFSTSASFCHVNLLEKLIFMNE